MSKLFGIGENYYNQLGSQNIHNSNSQYSEIIINDQLNFSNNINKIRSIHSSSSRTVFLFNSGIDTIAYITLKHKRKLVSLPISENIQVKDVKVGDQHILILTLDGKLYSYGGNDYGQLGYDTPKQDQMSEEFDSVFYSNKPRLIRPPFHNTKQENNASFNSKISGIFFTQIAVGSHHNLALTNTGALYTWGKNTENQLGIKTDLNNNKHGIKQPGKGSLLIELLSIRGTPIKQITAAKNTSFFLSYSGDVYGFGSNDFGQLGFNSKTDTTVNKNTIIHKNKKLINRRVVKIAIGLSHGLALTKDKRVWSWGSNSKGQLGFSSLPQSTNNSPEHTNSNRSSPVPLIEEASIKTNMNSDLMGSNILDIAAGNFHSVILTDGYKAYAYGGDDTVTNYSKINKPYYCEKISKIFANDKQTFLITEDKSSMTNPGINLSLSNTSQESDQMDCDSICDETEDTEDFIPNEPICSLDKITGLKQYFLNEKNNYSYSAILNVSFLKNDHHLTDPKSNSGINWRKVWKIYESWVGVEDTCRGENNIHLDLISRNLLPSLSFEPPCIEAIRLYLFLPIFPQFKINYKPSSNKRARDSHPENRPNIKIISSIHSEFCNNIINLPKSARKVLRNWLQNDVPKKIFKIIVERFVHCVSIMCEEHTKSRGSFSLRTPLNTKNFRSYEITDHPSPESLIIANRTVVNIFKFLNMLNYVNEQRIPSERIDINTFYLSKEVLTSWDWTDDWTRRAEERYVLKENFNEHDYYTELNKMDNYRLGWNQKNESRMNQKPGNISKTCD